MYTDRSCELEFGCEPSEFTISRATGFDSETHVAGTALLQALEKDSLGLAAEF